MNMKKICWLIIFVECLSLGLNAQSVFRHKSEIEIFQMTPSQRVIEFCDDHANHLPHVPNDYNNALEKAFSEDGLKVLPQIIRELDSFDPVKMRYGNDKVYRRYEGACFLLGDIDSLFFRVRGYKEGRDAISALERSYDRISKENYSNNRPENDEMWRRLRIIWNIIERLKKLTFSDDCVTDTLKIKFAIVLTENEQIDFINYLSEVTPKYPSSSERVYSKTGKRTCVYKEPELFQQAYLAYKATKKQESPTSK
jgi:hypothetical protein